MAEYKQVDLQIGTEAQFETKKAELPVGTIVGITDPIHEEELDSDLQTAINSISNKLDKPSGNPTEDSLVKVSSTGSTSYVPLIKLYKHKILLNGEYTISFVDSIAKYETAAAFIEKYVINPFQGISFAYAHNVNTASPPDHLGVLCIVDATGGGIYNFYLDTDISNIKDITSWVDSPYEL